MEGNITPIEICNRMGACLDEMAEAKGIARCGLIYAMAQLIDCMQGLLKGEREAPEMPETLEVDIPCTTEPIPSPLETEP